MSEAQHVCPPPEPPACPPEPPKEEKCVPPPKPQLLIMAPPFYADLGKNARDVFGKGYHFGLLKLDVKTKTSTGVEFSTGGVSNQETGKVFGSLETKYKFKDLGLTFTEKWNTDNVLTTELACSDFIEGAKVSLDTSFVPHSGERSGRLKSEWKSDFVALNAELEHKRAFIVKSGAVMNYSGWLCGAQATVDPAKGKLSNLGFSLGCIGKEFILNTSVNDARLFSGSVYHKVSNKLETAVALSWASDNNDTELGIGCKYNLDDDSALRLKVNNQSLIGVGYSQRLREGVTLSLSAQLDGKNFNEGGHKIGVCLELEA